MQCVKIIIKVFLGYFQQNEQCAIFEIKILWPKQKESPNLNSDVDVVFLI